MAEQPAMGPIEALKIALSLEVEAAEFYKQHAVHPSTAQEVFLFLQNEEEKHRRLIEKKLREMTG